MKQDILLVGSIPLDTPEEVFREFGKPLGASLKTMPDGEVGPRKHWISRMHYQVLSGHPELETVQRAGARERGRAAKPPQCRRCMVVQGQGRRRARPLRRCGLARRLRARRHQLLFRVQDDARARHPGRAPALPGVARLGQQRLPPRIFPNKGDVEKIRPGFTEAVAAEVDTIVKHIPNNDLAIQWDCSTEVQDVYGAVPGYSIDGAVERNIAQFRTLSPRIPESVELGYHLCFGTLGGWPRFAPADLSATVDLANGIIEASGRRVDWIHIPVLPDVSEVVLRAIGETQAARRTGLSRRRPSHGRLQGAHRNGAKIPAGIRTCGLLRLRPHPAGGNAGGAQRTPSSDQSGRLDGEPWFISCRCPAAGRIAP